MAILKENIYKNLEAFIRQNGWTYGTDGGKNKINKLNIWKYLNFLITLTNALCALETKLKAENISSKWDLLDDKFW